MSGVWHDYLSLYSVRRLEVKVCDCLVDDAGGSDMVSGMSSPTGSGGSQPYPPVRRVNKMSAMQIR